MQYAGDARDQMTQAQSMQMNRDERIDGSAKKAKL